jgi:hypothetical protein
MKHIPVGIYLFPTHLLTLPSIDYVHLFAIHHLPTYKSYPVLKITQKEYFATASSNIRRNGKEITISNLKKQLLLASRSGKSKSAPQHIP